VGLADTIRNVVGVANALTAGLQPTVSHEAFSAVDGNNKPSYAAAVARKAIVTRTRRWVRAKDDTVKQARFEVAFVSNIPIDVRDRITVNGETGPILDVKQTLDDAGNGYVTEVVIG
jgi:hypothetical protein